MTKLKTLPDESANCCITSPPYYQLRDYGIEEQIGMEESPSAYVKKLTDVFREVKRVLTNDGTLWLNIADSYAGSGNGRGADGLPCVKEGSISSTNGGQTVGRIPKRNNGEAKPKDMIGIPWMLAFALREDGWYLRQDIIWDKSGNCFPESVTDRCTRSHEYLFLLSKSARYYFDYEAILEPARQDGTNGIEGSGGRHKRDVWHINTSHCREAHFAVFPEELVEPCILAGCPLGGMVLDPFFGSGTTGRVATKLHRDYIGIELNPEYIEIATHRANEVQLTLTGLI